MPVTNNKVNGHSTFVKLPKLTIKPFVSDTLKSQQFQDSFNTSSRPFHQNESLSNIEKFNYLKSYLRGPALRSLDGLSITDDNYADAVSVNLLMEKYGDKSITISAHYKLKICTKYYV